METAKQIPLKVWLLGLVWAIVAAMLPVGVLLLDWVTRWQDPPDWTMVAHQAIGLAVMGAVGYWRKHKALLQLPPSLVEAHELQASAAKASQG